jgi:hypothetical protein
MPLMDGGELAERIRDLDPKVPIVLMSAPLSDEAAELLAGYSDLPLLPKPFTIWSCTCPWFRCSIVEAASRGAELLPHGGTGRAGTR